ncbi:unnamed protein product [Closterium sp. Naga37s-1]|nr:unnamed protein product [Closterium sp. Naga37s-1]
MLLGQDWMCSANADILTSKGKIVYSVNTKETDSVPITTGPLGVGGHPSFMLLPSHTSYKMLDEEDEEHIKAGRGGERGGSSAEGSEEEGVEKGELEVVRGGA